ncbi:hypothetical protein BJY04DRAFT_215436 [Aspergillus karnatakaensis]|uniref:FAD-dependent monooxygenase fmqD n=1 Tax=Aspergillus karnatakaensis TaxID=1810916 RepID=UPI003CCCA83E
MESKISELFKAQTWSPQAVLHLRGTDEFNKATERWNTHQAPTFAAVLSIGSEEDVSTAIKLVLSHRIPFLATGSRHGYGSTLGEMRDGLALDLSLLKDLNIDVRGETLIVGPGVRAGDVLNPVYEAGFQFPTGACNATSLIGVTLGGGIGRLNGEHGLMIDVLLSARIVIATGQILDVSSTSNPDLFWAIRGAGQNFGIVTSATYKLFPLTGPYTSVDLIFPPNLKIDVFNWFANFEITAKWAVGCLIGYNNDIGSPYILINIVHHGPEAETLSHLTSLLDLGPIKMEVHEIPWNKVTETVVFGMDAAISQPGEIRDVHGFNLRSRDAKTLIEVFDMACAFYDAVPTARSLTVLFEGWSNAAVKAVEEDETAFPWRGTEVYGFIVGTWPEGDEEPKAASQGMAKRLRATLAETSGYDGLAVYVNYAKGDETLEQIYGAEKLPKLARLKGKYDPENIFRFHHAIPSAHPQKKV